MERDGSDLEKYFHKDIHVEDRGNDLEESERVQQLQTEEIILKNKYCSLKIY